MITMSVAPKTLRVLRSVLMAMAAATAVPAPVAAESPYLVINEAAATSPVTVQKLRGAVSVLQGSGGNIGVLSGPEGVILVDAGIAVSQAKIQAALQALGGGSVRHVITTHWHWDHADGNGWLRAAGASVLAHADTAKHLSQTIRVAEWEHTFEPVPVAARPDRLISSPEQLTLNGETVRITPFTAGHTNGDLVVYFEKADVLQLGDIYWNGQYPFIDYVAGGSIDGSIRQAEAALALATSRTIIVPGHGPVGGRAELKAYRDMLVSVRSRVAALKRQGRSLEQVLAAKPTASFDGQWGASVVSGSLFTALVYRGV